jgi:hypothetical protein
MNAEGTGTDGADGARVWSVVPARHTMAPLPSREGFAKLREQGGRVSWLEAVTARLPGLAAQWLS